MAMHWVQCVGDGEGTSIPGLHPPGSEVTGIKIINQNCMTELQ